MRQTVSATDGAIYSDGGFHAPRCAVTKPTAAKTSDGSLPDKMLEPHSTVSGRSVTSRIVTLGTPKIQDSSCTVPLSDSRQNALCSRRTKSKNPSGSGNESPARFRSIPKASTLDRVRGCSDQIGRGPCRERG